MVANKSVNQFRKLAFHRLWAIRQRHPVSLSQRFLKVGIRGQLFDHRVRLTINDNDLMIFICSSSVMGSEIYSSSRTDSRAFEASAHVAH
jgi:hypothetical protein